MTPTFSWLLSEKCPRHCCDADRKWDCRGILEQIHARKKKSECRKKAEYLKCCTQTFRCNKLKSIKWKTLTQVKVLSPYFLFFLSTSDLNEESSPTNFIDNKQRTWHPGRLVPVDRSHTRDTDRSRGGSRGTASRRRGVYSSSSFPAEVVSELSLHTAAITVPERVFTFNQPEINLRDVWPETWQDVWHRTRVCLLAGCLY